MCHFPQLFEETSGEATLLSSINWQGLCKKLLDEHSSEYDSIRLKAQKRSSLKVCLDVLPSLACLLFRP